MFCKVDFHVIWFVADFNVCYFLRVVQFPSPKEITEIFLKVVLNTHNPHSMQGVIHKKILLKS